MKKELRIKSIQLRKRGYSIKEIHKIVAVSKDSVSIWVRDVKLSKKAQNRLRKRYTDAQLRSQETIRKITEKKNLDADNFSKKLLGRVNLNKHIQLVLCSMVYWCEGNKGLGNAVTFTNSDPALIRSFLFLLRNSFDVEERKFRILMHLHDYHNENKQMKFWSIVTQIPKANFHRTYWKPSKHAYRKEGYQGCIKPTYQSVEIARKLQAVARNFMERYK